MEVLADVTGIGAVKHFTVAQIEKGSLHDKVYIVTGGASGIGFETTKALVVQGGAKVYIASRTESKVRKVISDLESQHVEVKGRLVYLKLDLKDLNSAKEAAKIYLTKEKRLDGLVANAGEMATPYELTKDGIESQFQVNHLSHFVLITALAELMEKTGAMTGHPARVVNLSSFAHNFISFYPFGSPSFDSLESVNRSYGPGIGTYMRYSVAKLSNILSAREINKRYSKNLRAIAVHPGFSNSGLYDHQWMVKPVTSTFISTEEGALSSLYALTSQEVEDKNLWGAYLVPFAKVKETTAYGKSEELAGQLWDFSEAITREKLRK